MKNTTLARKPGNDMKKNTGLVRPVRRSDQAGDGEDFAFNGQMGDGVNRAKNVYAGNQSGETMKERYARGATKGNTSSNVAGMPKTMATAAQGTNIGSGFKCPSYGNPDSINVGMKK